MLQQMQTRPNHQIDDLLPHSGSRSCLPRPQAVTQVCRPQPYVQQLLCRGNFTQNFIENPTADARFNMKAAHPKGSCWLNVTDHIVTDHDAS